MKFLVIFVLIFVKICRPESDFIATEEWQEIQEGQKVPAGLHYRMNLQTGKKEAKILDPNDQNIEDTAPIATSQDGGQDSKLIFRSLFGSQ